MTDEELAESIQRCEWLLANGEMEGRYATTFVRKLLAEIERLRVECDAYESVAINNNHPLDRAETRAERLEAENAALREMLAEGE
jgi:hypothetical protein